MSEKDIVSKKLIQRIAVDLAVYLLKLDIQMEDLELLSTEQQRVEDRRADLVAKVKQNNTEYILHIEIQNNNDKTMPLRMLRYYTDIAFAYPNKPIHQYMIYIGSHKLRMSAKITDYGLNYLYGIIDMHTIDYRELLKYDTPDAIVLAILGDFKQHSTRQAVENIVTCLDKKLENEPQRFREYLYMLETLSENRNLKNDIKEVETMITQVKLENLPSYELGMERGKEIGIEKGKEIGVEKGKEIGVEKGKEIGVEIGMELIINTLLKSNTPEQVAKLTELPLEKIIALNNNRLAS